MSIDLNKLTTLLNAAKSESFAKLIKEQEAAEKAVATAQKHLEEINEKLEKNIPEELRSLLTATPAKTRNKKGGSKGAGLKPDLQELKSILAKADDKTLNIRKEGYDTANIKTLAAANPSLLKMGGKSPWPTVTLLK